MTIENHIERLLARRGRVTVPGLGSFHTEPLCARRVGNTLLPPGAVVRFSPVEGRDTELAEALMQERAIPYDEALRLIREADIRPDNFIGRRSYLPANYGLKELHLTPARRASRPAELGRVAAILLAALLINAATPSTESATHHEAGFVPAIAERVHMPVQETEEAEPEVAPEPERHYFVIVASLPVREQALRWIAENHMVDNATIVECDGRCRVAATAVATYAEAQNYIRANGLNAWVLKH